MYLTYNVICTYHTIVGKFKHFFFYISVWAIMFNTLTWDLLCQMTTKYHSVYNVHWRKISICGLDKGNFASIIGATIHWVVGSIERSCDGNLIVFFFIFTVSFHYKKKFPVISFYFSGKKFLSWRILCLLFTSIFTGEDTWQEVPVFWSDCIVFLSQGSA